MLNKKVVLIGGGVETENDVFIGASATVIKGVKVETNSVTGAGSLVIRDVPPSIATFGRHEKNDK